MHIPPGLAGRSCGQERGNGRPSENFAGGCRGEPLGEASVRAARGATKQVVAKPGKRHRGGEGGRFFCSSVGELLRKKRARRALGFPTSGGEVSDLGGHGKGKLAGRRSFGENAALGRKKDAPNEAARIRAETAHDTTVNFLTYTGFQASVGISHQKSNLTAMLKEAALSGRELIVPHFHLTGAHNRGRPLVSQLAEYFDFSQAAVAGISVPISTCALREGAAAATRVAMSESLIGRTEKLIVKDAAGEGLLRLPLEAVYRGFAALPVRLPTHPALTGLAAALALEIPAHAAWVHVRRGDALDRTAAATSPENIRRVLQAAAPATEAIYLATDERQPGFFAPLAAFYRVMLMEDFPAFQSLGLADNYKIFLAEQAFGAFFPTRISTFRTTGGYFQGWLCDLPGWQ